MTDLFISDLHLSPERPVITRAFFDFLESTVHRGDSLYILGDLVEAWIGDDDPSALSRTIVEKLRAVTNSGSYLYILHGNRDFLIGRRFSEQTGAALLDDYHVLNTSAGTLLLCHGDTLCTDDIAYQKFRRKVRNPVYRWVLAHLPLRKRQQIAQDWRLKSRQANANKADNIMDVNTATVNAVMAKFQADILLHGHTHRPAIHEEAKGRRIVLGDWDEQGWYAISDAHGLALKEFDISK